MVCGDDDPQNLNDDDGFPRYGDASQDQHPVQRHGAPGDASQGHAPVQRHCATDEPAGDGFLDDIVFEQPHLASRFQPPLPPSSSGVNEGGDTDDVSLSAVLQKRMALSGASTSASDFAAMWKEADDDFAALNLAHARLSAVHEKTVSEGDC